MQSRYYDPEIGRFLNADAFASTGQGILGNNMFAYCRNNPASRIDASGFLDNKITEKYDDDVEVAPLENELGGGGGGSFAASGTASSKVTSSTNGYRASGNDGNSGKGLHSASNTTGPGQAPKNGNPGSTYTQVSSNGKGQTVSITTYGEYHAPSTRVDYIGRDHGVGLPHIHYFSWRLHNGIVQPTGEIIVRYAQE